MNLTVPSLGPGQRSLPASMRTPQGPNFAQRRLAMGMQGLFGLGQDDGEDDGGVFITDSGSPLTTSGTDPIIATAPAATISQTTQTLTGFGVDPANAAIAATYAATPSGYTGPTTVAATAATPAAPNGYQWATLVNASGQNLAKILTIAQGGSSVTLPNGTQLLYGSSASAAGAAGLATSLTSVLSNPTLLLVGGGILVFMLLSKK
jgi:hypothetical protein